MNLENTQLSTIGKRIRRIREEKGLSRNALADIVSNQANTTMSPTTLLSIESGQGANLRTIIRIAEALQISLTSLFDLHEVSTSSGMRVYEQAIRLFGYSSERYRVELRLDHDGGASDYLKRHREGTTLLVVIDDQRLSSGSEYVVGFGLK